MWKLCISTKLVYVKDGLACDDVQAILYNYIVEKLICYDTQALNLYYGLSGLL